MRRLGKRIVAITMAAAMMTSLTPQGCTFLQQQIVYAAEQSEENLQPIYVQTEAVTSDQKDLKDDNWGDDKPIIAITESVANTEITSNFNMTADITIDETGYQNLAAEGSYLKLQGVVKTGEKWDWVDSQTIPYLEQKNFEKTDDGYTTSITIPFKDKTAAELKGVYFVVVGNGFHGVITFSNTKLTPIEVATSKEVLAYACEKNGSVNFDFSALEEEDWNTLPSIELETDIAGANIGKNAICRGKITIDQDTYASLDKEGSYIKLQTVMKLGADWSWTQGGSYPYLDKNSFTANEDGTYSATFEDKYSDIAASGDLHVLIVRAVGIGAKGSIAISDVNIYNVISADAPLPEKEATVVDDFESAEIGSAAGWENEAGWQYDKDVTATVQEQNSSKMLKLDLDYTGCEGYTWSEAKIKKSFEEGLDVSAYNQLTYDMIYPAEFDGKFKVKVFAKEADSNTEIINKEAVIETSDLGDGMKKASVTLKFSPNTAKITDLTLGTVGISTAFKGAVYIDNVKLSQYDAGADFVEITSTPDNENATKANIDGMSTTVSLADAGATNATLALYSYLQNLDAKDQVLFGHQNDTHKSVNTSGSGSDCKDVTGTISGLVGIDSLALTGVELGLDSTDAAVAKAIEIGQDVAAQGGIVSLSMHMPNMSSEKIVKTGTGYDFSACDFEESKDLSNDCAKEVLPGGKYNEQFKAYLDIIAEYANGLKDKDGESIPVLFRPFHECDGGWFWWGNAATDNETYKALFRYTEDYLNEKGVNNFIYVYSPGGPVEDDYLDRYPGDDYVDVLAFDYYDDYSNANASYSDEYMNNLKTSCEKLAAIAKEHGKVAAIGEAGVRVMKADGSDQEGILVKNNPIKGQNWYSKVNNVAKETGMSYFLLWANFSDTNFYIPYKYNDTKGQELINEFIDFYNEESSVFADGTNFYDAADKVNVTNENKGEAVSGYITNIISKEVIKEPTTLKANVTNGTDVKFVLKNGDVTVEIPAVKTEGSNEYTAKVTADNLTTLGKTDVGTITLVAGGKELTTLNFISFGKEKDVLPANVLENFELYYGDDGYLGGTFSENSAAGCSSVFTLDGTNKMNGSYGGKFTYTLKNTTSEVWTGRIKGTLTNHDFSGYNAIQMWVKPDKVEKKMVVQLTDVSGEEFEVYLSDFTSTSDQAQYVTIPFSSFVGKQGGTLNKANIQKFAVWCNSVKDNTDVTSSIYFDDIQAVNISASEIASKDKNGLIITNEAIGTTEANNGGGSTTTPSNPTNPGSSTSIEPQPDGSKVETTTETKADGTTVETVTTTKPDGSKVIVVSEQETNAAGNKVAVTTTTNKDAAGNVTGTTQEKVIAAAAANTTATVTTETNSTGDKTVTAEVVKTGTKSVAGTKGTISSAVVAQITDAAGTKDVEITQTVVDAAGKMVYTVSVNASDLNAGDKLKIFKYDEKKNEYILVNNKDYKVSSQGGVALTIKGNSTYKLMNQTDANKIVKEILATVKVASASKTVSKGKTTKISLSRKLNMANVSKITYSSTKSSVAKVDKKGKITAKKAGTATVKAKVTLKNGKTKTVTMKVKVK